MFHRMQEAELIIRYVIQQRLKFYFYLSRKLN